MSDERDPLESVEPTRRSFIKKMAAAAFVAPIVTSFGMETLASASSGRPNHTFPNQTFPNQWPPPCDPPKHKPKKHRKPKKPKKRRPA
jgi:hypothetical protein